MSTFKLDTTQVLAFGAGGVVGHYLRTGSTDELPMTFITGALNDVIFQAVFAGDPKTPKGELAALMAGGVITWLVDNYIQPEAKKVISIQSAMLDSIVGTKAGEVLLAILVA